MIMNRYLPHLQNLAKGNLDLTILLVSKWIRSWVWLVYARQSTKVDGALHGIYCWKTLKNDMFHVPLRILNTHCYFFGWLHRNSGWATFFCFAMDSIYLGPSWQTDKNVFFKGNRRKQGLALQNQNLGVQILELPYSLLLRNSLCWSIQYPLFSRHPRHCHWDWHSSADMHSTSAFSSELLWQGHKCVLPQKFLVSEGW